MALRTIELILHGNAGQAIAEMEKLATATSVSADTMHAKISTLARNTTLAMTGLGLAIAGVSVKLADDFETSHARLETAVKNSGLAFDEVSGQVDKADSAMEKFGFSNTETENSLARLVSATHDVTKSTSLLGLASDIAAARHMSLEAATDLLVKVEGGRYTQLGRSLGLSKEVIDSFKNQDDAIKFLSDRYQGSASAAAETFQGKTKALQAQLEDIGIKIGQAVIPVIEDLASALSDVIGWFKRNEEAAKALGIVIGTVLAAAVSIFVYDKVAAFVAGLQRMATGLGLMGTQATATAAEVDASAASMDGASIAAGGAGTSMLGIVGPLALVAGGAYGLYAAFNDAGITIDLNAKKLEERSSGALTRSIEKLVEWSGKIGDSSGAMKAFNEILDKSPQDAQKFIAAADAAGLSTDRFKSKLQEHMIATEEAKVAQERLALQMEIVDAKARGDSDAVYALTLRLNALPTDTQIQFAVNGLDYSIYQVGQLQQQLGYLTSQNWAIAVNIQGDTSLAGAISDRNVKRDIVPVSWN